MGPDFKTGIRNGTRHAIVRLEQHLPFKSKISFGEEKISFAISYREIEIKKVSPKSQLLKPTVICTNHPPFHPPIHSGHPTFVHTGGTESEEVTLQWNIKTVSQNGTSADHNAVSFPTGVDSFTAALNIWKSANHVTSSKEPKSLRLKETGNLSQRKSNFITFTNKPKN